MNLCLVGDVRGVSAMAAPSGWASACRGGDKKGAEVADFRSSAALKVHLKEKLLRPTFPSQKQIGGKMSESRPGREEAGSIHREGQERRTTPVSLGSAHMALCSDLTLASFLKDVQLWEFSRNLARLKFQVWRVGGVGQRGTWQSAAGAVHSGGAGLAAQTHQLYSCHQKDGCNRVALLHCNKAVSALI